MKNIFCIPFLIIFSFSTATYSQNDSMVTPLTKYKRFGLVVGTSLYQGPKQYYHEGDYEVDFKPLYTLNLGFEYVFNLNKNNNLVFNFITNKEPVYNVSYDIQSKDLDFYNEGISDNSKSYSLYTFSFPIYYSYTHHTKNNRLYLNYNFGASYKYFPIGGSTSVHSYTNTNGTINREVFGVKVNSVNKTGYASLIFGAGINYFFDKFMLRSNIVFNYNFGDFYEGTYVFDNLLVSPYSKGKFKVSGNFVALHFIIHRVRKPKKQ